MRRLLPVLAGLVIVGGGLLGLLTLFRDRDSAGLASGAAVPGPGTLESAPGSPPTSGEPGPDNLVAEIDVADPVLLRALAIGDVALVYGTAKPPPALVRLREEATGPFDPELAAAGQMAFLVRREGVQGVQALAWKRRLATSDPADPQLRAFVDAWLGKGRGDTG